MHVHVLGNGKSGSGCRITSRWWQRPFIELMAANIGLATSPGDPSLDELYVERLVYWVRDSTLERAVILACDDLHDETGHRFPGLSGLYVPNDYVFELSRRHPMFIPAASIHPARSDAIAELERCIEAGAAMLKLLPCVQAVECNRATYKPFWERMARLNLPLLAHTGGEFSLPTHRRDLQSVETLRLPLECGVNVIAAHCGTPALPWDRDYFDQFEQMRNSFPNLYGDLSALSQITHLRTLDRLRKDPRRILYGSDYPVLTTALWSRIKGWIGQPAYQRIRSIRNPLEKKAQLTLALGFSDRIFTDFWGLAPAPHEARKGRREELRAS
ncbi:MAG: amidohydrolase family protein [Verrucomicrobia bacterium]|nr:amidohydrolase family protein [Verrucomicrobiota bacterium]